MLLGIYRISVFRIQPELHSVRFTSSKVVDINDRFFYQGSCGSWNTFSRFSRPGKSLKTDMVLESLWICVWRSLKVLEFDFLKCRDRISYFHLVNFSDNSSFWLMLGGVKLSNVNWTCLYMLIKVPVWVNLVLRIYHSYGPWKSLNLILTNEQELCSMLKLERCDLCVVVDWVELVHVVAVCSQAGVSCWSEHPQGAGFEAGEPTVLPVNCVDHVSVTDCRWPS